MKQFYSFILLVFGLQISFGQIGFTDSVLFDKNNNIGYVNETLSVDIDNDGDKDILVATATNIGWFEQIDINSGDYSNFNIITQISTNNSDITSMYVIDVDMDGDEDIVFGSSYDNKIFWIKNLDGLGNFGESQLISDNIDGLKDIKSDDIDGDGDNDIISISSNDGKIAWYENLNGLGSFGNQQIIAIINQPNSVLSVDIDMDGDMDLVSNSFSNNEVIWFENLDGLGTFGTENLIEQLDYFVSNSMDASDVDGDGDYDLIVGYSTGTIINDRIVWFENSDGFGNFSSGQMISSNIDAQDSLSVVSLDFDNDGDNDVISASDNDGKIAWYENINGLGDFALQVIISDSFEDVQTLDVVDVNEDGVYDIFGGLNAPSQVSEIKLRYNFSDGGFYENTISSSFGGLGELYPIDVDNDGSIDIVSRYSSQYNDKFLWLKNIDGSFENISPQYVSTGYRSVRILPANINNDEFVDFFVRSSLDDVTLWCANYYGSIFPFSVFDSNDETTTFSFSTNDLNGDGFDDLVMGRTLENEIVWYQNSNGVTFSSENLLYNTNTVPISNSSTNVHTSDIDGDGDYDILASIGLQFNESKIVWFENIDGLGNFSEEQFVYYNTGGSSVGTLYTADLDLDGDLDVVTYWRFEDKIVWYENSDGNGNFNTERIVATNVDDVVDLSIGDLDGDGDMDVVSISDDDGVVAWYNNQDGLGNFSSQQIIASNQVLGRSVVIHDIDNDGNTDVVSSHAEKIVFHKNIGIATNEISGLLKVDINSDGCNTGNISVNNLLVETTDGSNSISTFSLGNGYYQLFPEEGSFTTSLVSELPNYYTSNPNSQTSNFTEIGNIDIINFCLEPTSIFNDLNISIYPSLNDPRPGFDTTYQIVYQNIGTTQLSGSVSFEFDDTKLQFLSASETVTSQTANTLNFDFTDLNPFETRTIDLEFNVFAPPITNIDDVLVSTATINPVSGDETEEDNTFELNQTVIGSYDPNDITVLEGDEIFIEDADKYLHYLIRFQNTGTASAINVRVEHILDDKLDWATMQLESLSHTGRVEIENQTDVSFIFNNINLPDSTSDEPNSHGYIAFKIKPKSNVQVGDIISGVADIYFDFNPPIITNTVNTEIVEPLSIDDVSAETVKLYPNPAKNIIQITSNQVIEALTVIDINGRTLQSLEISTTDYSLDISNLSKGAYFVELLSGDSKSTKKFIKN
jgi:hypothetical protein